MRRRNKSQVLLLLVGTTLAGLGSREFAEALPTFVATYAGDTLWAATLYGAFALLMGRRSATELAFFALLASFAVELSQLYRAPWILSLRGTTLGGLLLGHGFIWSDLVCYSVGIAAANTVDRSWVLQEPRSETSAVVAPHDEQAS